jgi:hypothetical protein
MSERAVYLLKTSSGYLAVASLQAATKFSNLESAKQAGESVAIFRVTELVAPSGLVCFVDEQPATPKEIENPAFVLKCGSDYLADIRRRGLNVEVRPTPNLKLARIFATGEDAAKIQTELKREDQGHWEIVAVEGDAR